MEKNRQEVLMYLKNCGVCVMTTEENGPSRVRSFCSGEILDGQLVNLTGKVKDVYDSFLNWNFTACIGLF